MKHTLQDKLKYVKMHLEDNVPIYEIERKYGFNAQHLKYFCRLYLRYGEKPFLKLPGQRQKYTREMKLKAIDEHFSMEKPIRQIAVDLMLSDPKIVSDWIKLYKTRGESAIKDTYSREAYMLHDDKLLEKEYKKLLEDLERTKAENDYLKKSFPQVLKRGKQSKKKS